MEASWSRLGDVLERLGPSWGDMWASWERLGGILCLIFRPKWVKFRYAILDVILQLIFDGFCLQNSMPEKSLNSIGKISIFCFRAALT